MTTADRFWAKTVPNPTTGCIEWTASRLEPDGYGYFYFAGRMHLAHRIAYTLVRGEIPDGLTLDHTCCSRGCVNPAHLEPVTNAENYRRYKAREGTWHAKQRAKTHCPLGHSYDEANTYVDRKGNRNCRTCSNQRRRKAAA